MNEVEFTWDPKKAASNARKHGVTFEEAASVFLDENARIIEDVAHSKDEDRFILLGISGGLRLLVVVHCLRQDDQEIRIISARRASKKEHKQYGSFI